ncbi:MAG: hypothetical protein SFV54_27990 [Bryobacteraceae bacterium]|nr:hypothetical protein [Bryobacteraceae bacterium]
MSWRALVVAAALRAYACGAIEGAAVWSGDEVVAWGDGVYRWKHSRGNRRLARGKFDEGGCIAQFGGRRGLALQARGKGLQWFEEPRWKPVTIDEDVVTRDCVGVTLFGREGVLVVHRGAQVRFYERPAQPAKRWPYREIYSIYTASWQGGLRPLDMNGDGRTDFLCGNYWLESPERFEEPWRLYPIHNWWDAPASATVRWTSGDRIAAAQRDVAPARAAWFERPAEARDLWGAYPAADGLRRVRALDARGKRLLAGEDAGPASRLFIIEEGRTIELERGPGYVFVQWNDAGRPSVVVSKNAVRWQELKNN